jgi:SOS-response transcriptional repressor LexA
MEHREILEAWINWKSAKIGRDYRSKDLAVDSETSGSYISQVRNGKRRIGIEKIERFAKAFGITPSQFLDGPPTRLTVPPPIPVYDQAGEQVGELSREPIPLLTSIPAGPWMAWLDTYPPGAGEEYIERLDVKGKHVIAIRVSGDSMEPELFNGDLLIIDPRLAFHVDRRGKIGIVKYDDSYKIRRIHLTPDGNNYFLEPANKAYEGEVIPVTGTTIYKIIQVRPKIDERF